MYFFAQFKCSVVFGAGSCCRDAAREYLQKALGQVIRNDASDFLSSSFVISRKIQMLMFGGKICEKNRERLVLTVNIENIFGCYFVVFWAGSGCRYASCEHLQKLTGLSECLE